MDDQKCSNCRFYFDPNDNRKASCRRYPPTVYDENAPDYHPVIEDPTTMWCGEWREKPKAAA